MNSESPIYVYEPVKYQEGKAEPVTGPGIIVIGALGLSGIWLNDFIRWVLVVSSNPFSRAYEAAIIAGLVCIAAYFIWRFVRMAYLMACALCFLTYDSGRKILNYFGRKRSKL